MADAEPMLPYEEADGTATAGWSGSEASRERAEREASDGTASIRQNTALLVLGSFGPLGLTWRDLAEETGWHHGQASGVLSVLHKEARIARLRAKRDKCQIYVLPEYVNDRPTSPYKPRASAPVNPDDVLTPAERETFDKAKRRLAVSNIVVCVDYAVMVDLLAIIETRTT